MRIDQLLNKLCLVKTRSIAKKACDNGLVTINDKKARASATPGPGDTIRFDLFGYRTVLRLTDIPKGNVAKKDAADYYELVEREKLDIPAD
ncbi:MAG: RNA-binding protein [Candidatus Cloacimonetes bacterium]|nr:RNA-binding protein [Candidatus Cloacimonadota bacterium]